MRVKVSQNLGGAQCNCRQHPEKQSERFSLPGITWGAQSSGRARTSCCRMAGKRLRLHFPFPQPCFIYRTLPSFCSG